jgi:peptidoglycan/xylan/chitin deacetylase (PgdA/CDA1 family)
MTKKPILMIHEVFDEIFNLDLEKYILTFDDALYSQFYYYPQISKIKTKKIFFVSTNIISNVKQSKNFLSCVESHKKAFNGNKEDYMNIDQIKFLMYENDVEIGAHSHNHKTLSQFKTLNEKVEHIKKDTELMINWFDQNLNYVPKKFCFPYNDDLNGFYKLLLKKYGFQDFYGKERLNVNHLLEKTSLKDSA